jgi:hypothetical protein
VEIALRQDNQEPLRLELNKEQRLECRLSIPLSSARPSTYREEAENGKHRDMDDESLQVSQCCLVEEVLGSNVGLV